MTAKTRFAILTIFLLAVFVLMFVGIPARAHEDANNETLVMRLAERVDELFSRVERLETLFQGPGAPDRDDGRTCLIAEASAFGPDGDLQHATIVSYLARFDQFPTDHRLLSVRVEKETGAVWVTYVVANEEGWFYTIEHWDGCQFEGSTDWKSAEG